MNEAIPFNADEIAAINRAKSSLQSILKDTKAFEHHRFDYLKRVVQPKNLLPEPMDNLVVAGGVFSSLILGEQYNDVDIFILNMDVDLFEDLMSLKTGPWKVRWFFNENEDPRKDDYKNEHVFATATNTSNMVQYILTDYKTRKELLDHFDLLHCTASYHNGKLFINRETFDAIKNKQLIRQHKKKAPKQWRLDKYLSRNWKSEEDSMLESSKSLKDTLLDAHSNLIKGWYNAKGLQLNTHNNVKEPYQSLEEEMEAIFKDGIDPYLQTR